MTFPTKGILKVKRQVDSIDNIIKTSSNENLRFRPKYNKSASLYEDTDVKQPSQTIRPARNLYSSTFIYISKLNLHSSMPIGTKSLLKSRRRVNFGDIQIREYKLIPCSCNSSSGSPSSNRNKNGNNSFVSAITLTLDWSFVEVKNIPTKIELYELVREPRRKELKELKLSDEDREEILLRQGYTHEEINALIEDSIQAQLKREETLNRLKKERKRTNVGKKESCITRFFFILPCPQRNYDNFEDDEDKDNEYDDHHDDDNSLQLRDSWKEEHRS